MPWRDIADPYRIWISEIILQQTRVNQGLEYYLRFIERFPDVVALADAEEDEVLKYWQGLGYYSRARNLHKASRRIVEDYGGVFPTTYEDIRSLSGVGDYTASAIASFAYGLPHATVDGNVYRVLSRLFAIDTPIDKGAGKKEFAALAQEMLSKEMPGLHNQAMMEFGALRCVPVSPDCENCPLQSLCRAYELDMVEQLPKKTQKTKVLNRYFNYLYIVCGEDTYLQRRMEADIWRGLYELPLIEADRLLPVEELAGDERFVTMFAGVEHVEITSVSPATKHVLSHRNIFAQFITVEVSGESGFLAGLTRVPLSEIDKYAVSRLTEIFLEKVVSG